MQMKTLGVASVKVVGRGMSKEIKVNFVKLVNKILEGDFEKEEVKRIYSNYFKNYHPNMCEQKNNCYYI